MRALISSRDISILYSYLKRALESHVYLGVVIHWNVCLQPVSFPQTVVLCSFFFFFKSQLMGSQYYFAIYPFVVWDTVPITNKITLAWTKNSVPVTPNQSFQGFVSMSRSWLPEVPENSLWFRRVGNKVNSW